jgi:hypothetical protein
MTTPTLPTVPTAPKACIAVEHLRVLKSAALVAALVFEFAPDLADRARRVVRVNGNPVPVPPPRQTLAELRAAYRAAEQALLEADR